VEEVIRHVEVPQVVEEIKHVPKIEVVDRPYEVVKEVPRVEIQKIEKVVDVGAEQIEVPKAHVSQQTVPMCSYNDSEAMLIVGQKVTPVIIDGAAAGGSLALTQGGHGHAGSSGEIVVDVAEYSPEVMPVDIHVAKFVDQELVMVQGQKETIHRVVTVSAMQYNSMLRYLNAHLSHVEMEGLPYLTDHTGSVQFLPQDFNWQPPAEGLKIYGYRAGQIWGQGSVVRTAKYSSGMSQQEMQAKQGELDRQFQQIFGQFEAEKTRRQQAVERFNQQQKQRAAEIIRTQSTVGRSRGDMFDRIDLNHDGIITRDEWVATKAIHG